RVSASIPQPLSATVTTAHSLSRRREILTCPPAGVNLTALERRLFHTRSKRASSLARSRSWSRLTSRSVSFSSKRASKSRMQRLSASLRLKGMGTGRIFWFSSRFSWRIFVTSTDSRPADCLVQVVVVLHDEDMDHGVSFLIVFMLLYIAHPC